MAKLVWQPQGQEPMAFAIRQERVAVGRDHGNDIRLPEPAVSARHAVIITRAGRSTLHDLNSSNGTWVNGKRVESQELLDSDVVQFGRLSMHFVDEASATVSRLSQRGGTQRDATVSIGPPQAAPLTHGQGAFQGAGPAAAPPEGPELEELDRLLGSIRGYRQSEAQDQRKRGEELQQEWLKVIGYCTALKARLQSEPKVRFFEVSERRSEVLIRIERTPSQPTQLIMLTLGHMERREKQVDGIWLRQPGQADHRFDKCADAMRELLTIIAHMVA